MDFSTVLIDWYEQNKRDLPWRKTKNPYYIWLSETILQQTRVNQGINYYYSFIEKYPTIHDLAKAELDDVLKLWQGLGYYSRAVNLHQTAKIISAQYDGKIPIDYPTLLKLKGIGEYTASAIVSFVSNQPYPVIDGNVYRVLSRIFGIEDCIDTQNGKKTFKQLATKLLDKENASVYNQAIMEFGAIQCKPKSPNCEECIFRSYCYAFSNKKVELFPLKKSKTKQKTRFFNYLVFNTNKSIILNKRINKDIWFGLHEFPLIETDKQIINQEELLQILPKSFTNKSDVYLPSIKIEHQLSHQKIIATFWKINTKKLPKPVKNQFIISLNAIHQFAVPRLIEKYIQKIL